MKILVAEDDPDTRLLLAILLRSWGHDPVTVEDGSAAWEIMQGEDAPALAILDWMMPGLDGLEVCRRARGRAVARPLYIILLTARTDHKDTVDGLGAGADDLVKKPFQSAELRARVGVGSRVVALHVELAMRVAELEQSLARIDHLHGILPICSYCKKVRSDSDSWQQVEAYVSAHSPLRFSHGVCPGCVKTVVQPQLSELSRMRALRQEGWSAPDDRLGSALAQVPLDDGGKIGG